MIGYKAFDKGLKCRGFQYEVGKVAEEQVHPEVCSGGLHFCAKPLDVLNYYDYKPGETEFAEVEAIGDIATEGDKASTNKLLIKAKLTFWDLFKINFKRVFENVESKENISSTTGNWAHSSTAGDEAHSSTAGNYAHSSTAGDEAHSSTTGDGAHSIAAGNYAHSSTKGKDSIAASLGIQTKAKASEGWLVLADWRLDPMYFRWELIKVVTVKVGDKLDDITIAPNVYYYYDNGLLKEGQ